MDSKTPQKHHNRILKIRGDLNVPVLSYKQDYPPFFPLLSPIDSFHLEAMRRLMKHLKGHFVLMALIAEGEWLMVGCRDEPLMIGGGRPPIYFGTDFEAVDHSKKRQPQGIAPTKNLEVNEKCYISKLLPA